MRIRVAKRNSGKIIIDKIFPVNRKTKLFTIYLDFK